MTDTSLDTFPILSLRVSAGIVLVSACAIFVMFTNKSMEKPQWQGIAKVISATRTGTGIELNMEGGKGRFTVDTEEVLDDWLVNHRLSYQCVQSRINSSCVVPK